jgi:hypothetical protein
MGALVAASLLIFGCTGIQPFEPRDNREEGPQKGLFTGSQGEFVIFRRTDASNKTGEDHKNANTIEKSVESDSGSNPSENMKKGSQQTP